MNILKTKFSTRIYISMCGLTCVSHGVTWYILHDYKDTYKGLDIYSTKVFQMDVT